MVPGWILGPLRGHALGQDHLLHISQTLLVLPNRPTLVGKTVATTQVYE